MVRSTVIAAELPPPGNDGIAHAHVVPNGWVSMITCARRAGVTRSTISRAKDTGKFSPEHMRWIHPKKNKVSAQPKLYIDWVHAAHPWVAAKPADQWPHGFNPNNPYAPPPAAATNPPPPPPQPAAPPPKAAPSLFGPPPGAAEVAAAEAAPVDNAKKNLTDAKIRKEQLAVQKLEQQVRREANTVMQLEDIAAVMSAAGKTIQAALKNMVTGVFATLAIEKDPAKVKQILDRHCDEVAAEAAKALDLEEVLEQHE